MQKILKGGIYPPLPTFFNEQEELDLAILHLHIQRLLRSGIAGYVLMGSNGEAVHLDDGERALVIREARQVLDQSDACELPIIAGCGAQSTRITIAHSKQAAVSGADFALVLPPFYYRSKMSQQALLAHYQRVADESPLPVILYNMPASAAGLDLNADLICTLAEHENIVGVKDSSGNVAKLASIVASVHSSFFVFTGSADTLLPSLLVGAVGAVSALANVFPEAVCHLQALFDQGDLLAARTLQAHIIPMNAAITTLYGIAGLKRALQETVGYGGQPRLPILPLTTQEMEKVHAILVHFQEHAIYPH